MSYQSRQASAGNQEQLKNNNFMTAESGAVKGVSSQDSLGVGGTVIEEEGNRRTIHSNVNGKVTTSST
jgi:hypothetical protein